MSGILAQDVRFYLWGTPQNYALTYIQISIFLTILNSLMAFCHWHHYV